jgi:ABC-type transport system involved in multi-copper enzyme maturation permease subunit
MGSSDSSPLAWLRQTLRLENTRRAWQERLAALLLVLAVAAALWGSGDLPLSQRVLVWMGVLGVLAVVLRHGWLRLFGPVLFYDLVRIGRRTRYFLLRTAYAVLLSLLLFWVYLIWYANSPDGNIPSNDLANFAQSFFYTFMVVQFVTAVVLTPAYTAGAIAEEKDRRTLEFMLATDLGNHEIVLSKLAARLANLALILLAGLPVLSALQFLGGVDPNLVLAGFAATGMTMLSLGGLSILNSVQGRRARDAIALTYLTAAAYVAITCMAQFMMLIPGTGFIWGWPGWSPINLGDVIDGLGAGNILAALIRLSVGVAGSSRLDDILPEILRNYAIFHGLVAVVCAAWAVLRLRVIAQRQQEGRPRRLRLDLTLRIRKRPRVGKWPMIWKELWAEPGFRLNAFGRIVVGVLVAVSFMWPGIGIYVFITENKPIDWLAEVMSYFIKVIGTMVACILLLGVAVRAASAVGHERDRQTLDALYTTPLDSDSILFAKWLGSVLSVRWGWLWLGAIWGLGVMTLGLHAFAVPLLLWAWFSYAAFLAALGLWFSVVSRTTLRATLWTLLTTAAAGVGHWILWSCCIPWFAVGGRGPGRAVEEYLETFAKFEVGLTPPLAMGWFLHFRPTDFDRSWRNKEAFEIPYGLLGTLVWIVAAVLVWVAVSRRFRLVSGRLPFRPARLRPRADGATTVQPLAAGEAVTPRTHSD